MRLSTIVELVFLAGLGVGVYIVAGLGWALVVGCSVGLVGAQFYGIDEEEK